MRLPSRAASSTSHAQMSECADAGESTKTTVSASLIKVAEALLPILTTGDAVAVDEAFKAASLSAASS